MMDSKMVFRTSVMIKEIVVQNLHCTQIIDLTLTTKELVS